jgi:hypothetical protein
MSHSFPPIEALEFETSLILVSLLYGLKNHDIVGFILAEGRLFIGLWGMKFKSLEIFIIFLKL